MKNQGDDNRRSFLKHLFAGAATLVGTAAIIKTAKANTVLPKTGTAETLYRESEEFKKYYRSLRS